MSTPPGVAKPRIRDTTKRKKVQSIPFAEIAEVHDELTRIERQLEELRALQPYSHSDAVGSSGGSSQIVVDGDVPLDPIVYAMLNVELFELAAMGAVDEMRILLESGADPNTRDYDARSLLHIAAVNGHSQVIELLLEFGANPTPVDTHGKTPLDYAEIKGAERAIELLSGHHRVSQGANQITEAESLPSSSTTPESPDYSLIPQPMTGSLIIIMVGLPGRGKTYITRQVNRYFQWNGLPAQTFSEKALKQEWKDNDRGVPRTSFMALEMTKRVVKFVSQSDGVAIIDGPHETPAQRKALLRELLQCKHIRPNRIIFVEVIIRNDSVVLQNILRAKDYEQPVDGDAFIADYYRSIEKCEAGYQTLNPLTDADLSYIRMEDSVVYSLNQISGWMPSRLALMLHNLNHSPTPLYLTRSGEYQDLVYGRIGGNSSLTPRGIAFSEALFQYFCKEFDKGDFLNVFSSCATRSTQTSSPFLKISTVDEARNRHDDTAAAAPTSAAEVPFNCRVFYFPTLDDINHGDCEGMLISDVKRTMPFTIQEMRADPYYTAWPNGECLHQVFNSRLEPHIHDIQASATPVLVISHLPLLQGLYSYFVSGDGSSAVNPQNAYQIEIPLETVIKIHVVRGSRVAEVINLSEEVNKLMSSTPTK